MIPSAISFLYLSDIIIQLREFLIYKKLILKNKNYSSFLFKYFPPFNSM